MARGNARQAARLYAAQFPNRQRPNHQTFSAVHNRLRETGKFKKIMSDTVRNRSVRDIDFEELVHQRFVEDPSTSFRVVTRQLGVSKQGHISE